MEIICVNTVCIQSQSYILMKQSPHVYLSEYTLIEQSSLSTSLILHEHNYEHCNIYHNG